ncbi:MAG: rod shape-determining protein MreC [Pelagibacteraceae bacterium]|nr:MAG: rod shape-determining protein MreC [Pelagibacteraceae bacterium]
MASSRNDFVIALRSAFLKKNNKQKFSLLTLIFISLIIISLNKFNIKTTNILESGLRDVIYVTSSIISYPEKKIRIFFTNINNYYKNYKNFKFDQNLLEKFNATNLVNEYLTLENNRLKNIIEESNSNENYLLSKVLIDKQSQFFSSIILNKGSKDNVELGMAVLDRGYLIGKIIEINYSTSRAILLNDINSKIPAIIEPIGIQVIISGTGYEHGIIQYSKDNYEIEDDLNIFTSGGGNVFKSGIPIGKLKKDINNADAKVEFFSDFSQLVYVNILLSKNEL